MRRRRIFGIVALVLVAMDGVFLAWFYRRHFAYNASITYVGLDSFEMLVPMRTRAAKLSSGRWDIEPTQALRSAPFQSEEPASGKPLAFVSLTPRPNYGSAIRVIRDLKARRICNLLIREGGQPEPPTFRFPDGDTALAVPALILCGSAIGDASSFTDLPEDGPIHVDGAVEG